MKPGIIAAVLWIFVFGGSLLLFGDQVSSASEFVKNLGIAASVATGVAAPTLAVFAARELEAVKNSFSTQIEILKNQLSENLEYKKVEIAAQVKAYDAILSAAHFFYYVIREQAFGESIHMKELFVEADKRAAEASAGVWHLPEPDRLIWYNVYQRSKYLTSILQISNNSDLPTLFNENAISLGEAIQELELAGEKTFENAKNFNLHARKLQADSVSKSYYLSGS